jgi:hypothetical protein
VRRNFSGLAGRLVTGPAAFLAAGTIDLIVFGSRWLAQRRSPAL